MDETNTKAFKISKQALWFWINTQKEHRNKQAHANI